MARRRVQFRSDMRPDFRPSDEDLRYALRWAFGSWEEMHEMFRDFEVRLVEDMHRINEEAKRKRDAEWPLPPEDDPPDAHGSVPRLVTTGQLQSDETAAPGTSSPQGAQVMKASTPEALKTGEAHGDKASR